MRIGVGINIKIPNYKKSGGGLPDKIIEAVLFGSPLTVSDQAQVRVENPISIIKNEPIAFAAPIAVTESTTNTIV